MWRGTGKMRILDIIKYIYKEGLEIKRNDSPRNGPSKGTGTIGNMAGRHWK